MGKQIIVNFVIDSSLSLSMMVGGWMWMGVVGGGRVGGVGGLGVGDRG